MNNKQLTVSNVMTGFNLPRYEELVPYSSIFNI